MKSCIASFFRFIFFIKPLRYFYFGLYKKLFRPAKLFKGVHKTILYKERFTLELDINDWLQQNIYFLGGYEEKELKFLKNSVKPGDCFIDAGANIGIFSLIASDAVGQAGHVYSFEPLEKNFHKLSRHITINGLNNITPEQLALTDSPGEMRLYRYENDYNDGMATAFPSDYNLYETVKATTLDDYFLQKNISSLAFIKLDIEGAEYLALKGMQRILENYHPLLLVEINPDVLKNTPFHMQDIEKFLANFSYKKMFLNKDGELVNDKLTADNSCNYVFI